MGFSFVGLFMWGGCGCLGGGGVHCSEMNIFFFFAGQFFSLLICSGVVVFHVCLICLVSQCVRMRMGYFTCLYRSVAMCMSCA